MEIIPNLGESDYQSIVRAKKACTLHSEHLKPPLEYMEIGVNTSSGIAVYGHIFFSDWRTGHELMESRSHVMAEKIKDEMEIAGYSSTQTNALINYISPLSHFEVEERGKSGLAKPRYRLTFNKKYLYRSIGSVPKDLRKFLRELARTKFLPKRRNLHIFEGLESGENLRALDHAGTVDISDPKKISIDFGGNWGYKRSLMPEDQLRLCLERDIDAVSRIYSAVMRFLSKQRGFEESAESAMSSVMVLQPDWSED